MAERPRATASGSTRGAPAAQPPTARYSTARVATTASQQARRSELPGWFWGALGCLTVLVVGLTIVFFVGQTRAVAPRAAGAASAPAEVPAATAAVAPAAPAEPPRAAEAPRARAGIQIEPMAPPPAVIDQPLAPPPAAARPRAPIKPIKMARSPAAAPKPAGTAKAPAAAPEEEKDEEAEPKTAKARTSAEDEADDR